MMRVCQKVVNRVGIRFPMLQALIAVGEPFKIYRWTFTCNRPRNWEG